MFRAGCHALEHPRRVALVLDEEKRPAVAIDEECASREFPDRTAETGRRSSFTLGADVHTTFAEGAALAFFTAGVGVDLY